jgi:hypothetical protein
MRAINQSAFGSHFVPFTRSNASAFRPKKPILPGMRGGRGESAALQSRGERAGGFLVVFDNE